MCGLEKVWGVWCGAMLTEVAGEDGVEVYARQV